MPHQHIQRRTGWMGNAENHRYSDELTAVPERQGRLHRPEIDHQRGHKDTGSQKQISAIDMSIQDIQSNRRSSRPVLRMFPYTRKSLCGTR